VLDPEARAYRSATGISLGRAKAFSKFLTGLATLGLRSNLVDGWVLRQDSQPAGGTTAYSLRGPSLSNVGNLTMTGNITRHRCGFIPGNGSDSAPATPSFCSGSIPALATDATLIGSTFRHKAADTSAGTSRIPWFLYNPDGNAGHPIHSLWAGQYGSTFMGYTYDGAAHFAQFDLAGSGAGHVQAECRYKPITLSNALVAASGSFTGRVPGKSASSVTGFGGNYYTKLEIGRYSDSGWSGWKGYDDSLVPYVLLFNKILSDTELAAVHVLIDAYIHPRVRIVTEGDSMAADSMGIAAYLQDHPSFFGANIDLVNVAALPFAQNLSLLDADWVNNANGISAALGSTLFPVLAVNWWGHHENETPLLAWSDSYNLMKDVWARQKAMGMKVVALTVNPTIDLANDEAAHGTETKRRAINAQMRLDAANRAGCFDYFLDTEAYFLSDAATGLHTLPAANTATNSGLWTFNNPTYFDSGHVHMTATGGNAITGALYGVIQSAIP